MLDPMALAELPRDTPLRASDAAVPFTCAICGVKAEPYTWRVTLPQRAGKACTGCASDHRFEVAFP